MKVFLIALVSILAFSAHAQKFNKDQQAIAQVIQTAYVEGLQNEGDTLKIDQGFHSDFAMIRKTDTDGITRFSIKDWRTSAANAKQTGKLPRPNEHSVSIEFEFIDITGTTAVAKLKYFEGKKHTYTDYITLYQFSDGWKMVSKAYYKVE